LNIKKLKEEIEVLYPMKDELQEQNKILRLRLESSGIMENPINLREFIELYPELGEQLKNVNDIQQQLSILYQFIIKQSVVNVKNITQGKNVILKPTDYDRRIYEVVTSDGIKYYLHNELYSTFRTEIDSQKWFFGRVVYVEEMIATDFRNQYRLAVGTHYYLVFIEKFNNDG